MDMDMLSQHLCLAGKRGVLVCRWKDGQLGRWMDGWRSGVTEGLMLGWMNEWMGGWMEEG